jgi:hypothetical protein
MFIYNPDIDFYSIKTFNRISSTDVTVDINPLFISFITINGLKYAIGDGNRDAHLFFSNDNGTTAKRICDIEKGDTLFFNPKIARFHLDTDDIIGFVLISKAKQRKIRLSELLKEI